MVRIAPGDGEVAAGDGARYQEGARLDAVGDNRVLGTTESIHTLDTDGGGTGAFNDGTHLDEQIRQVYDLGLAG